MHLQRQELLHPLLVSCGIKVRLSDSRPRWGAMSLMWKRFGPRVYAVRGSVPCGSAFTAVDAFLCSGARQVHTYGLALDATAGMRMSNASLVPRVHERGYADGIRRLSGICAEDETSGCGRCSRIVGHAISKAPLAPCSPLFASSHCLRGPEIRRLIRSAIRPHRADGTISGKGIAARSEPHRPRFIDCRTRFAIHRSSSFFPKPISVSARHTLLKCAVGASGRSSRGVSPRISLGLPRSLRRRPHSHLPPNRFFPGKGRPGNVHVKTCQRGFRFSATTGVRSGCDEMTCAFNGSFPTFAIDSEVA